MGPGASGGGTAGNHGGTAPTAGSNPADYRVEALDEGPAKRFVVTHHYSGTYPAAARRYGLWNRTDQLVGVAVFGIPATNRVLTNVFPDLEPVVESLECSRFVLLDGPGNEESWFLPGCFDQLAARGIRGIVSFADPVPRRTAAGAVVCPGHVGTINQATSRLRPRGTSTSPDSRTPESRTPDSRTPDSRTPDSRTPDSRTPDSGPSHKARRRPPVAAPGRGALGDA